MVHDSCVSAFTWKEYACAILDSGKFGWIRGATRKTCWIRTFVYQWNEGIGIVIYSIVRKGVNTFVQFSVLAGTEWKLMSEEEKTI
jgi:hypothetical protein